jgi:flavodoxin
LGPELWSLKEFSKEVAIMSKCLLVYYSQGGNTSRIAESIAKGLRASDHVVDLHNLKDGPAPNPGSYDFLGIGTPTYYFRPPFIVTDHLDSLPDLSGKPFFVFVVYGTDPGDAGNVVRRVLERKGGREIGYNRRRYLSGVSETRIPLFSEPSEARRHREG